MKLIIVFLLNVLLLTCVQYTAMSSEKEPKLSASSTSSATTKKSQASKKPCGCDDSENLTCEGFTKDIQGIVFDKMAGLEWYLIPEKDRVNVDWHKGKSLIESLTIGGGGWRLPSLEELKVLYKAVFVDEKKCSDLFFEEYFYSVWSSDVDGPLKAWKLFFTWEGEVGSFPRTDRRSCVWGVRARSR